MSLGTHRLPAAECKVTSIPLPLVPLGRPVFGNLGPPSGAMAEFTEDFRKPAPRPSRESRTRTDILTQMGASGRLSGTQVLTGWGDGRGQGPLVAGDEGR